jgi:hypothetical protein
MRTLLFQFNDLRIYEDQGRFFALYDAGSHQVAMRKDELTKAEADRATQSREDAIQVLFDLQKRLLAAGVDPYVSNTEER